MNYTLSNDKLLSFQEEIEDQVQLYISELYKMNDIPRNKIQFIISLTTELFNKIVSCSSTNIEKIMDSSTDNLQLAKYEIDKIFKIISNPFNHMESEWKQFKNFKANGTLIMPETFEIGERYEFKNVDGTRRLVPIKITAEKVPLAKVLKVFFESPGILEETIVYMRSLECETKIISNFIQGPLWKKQRSSFAGKIVFPLFLYFDEFETNNPLGSHKGISKCGGVYINLPSIPPQYQSKLENIFLYVLFNTLDRRAVSDDILFNNIITELNDLRSNGITVQLTTCSIRVYFQLSLLLGDNLGLHSLLGFSESFHAKYSCRFCTSERSDFSNITHENQCVLRDIDNYKAQISLNDISKSGIRKESVFNKVVGFHVTENLSVDPMHDFLEGICPHDIALILHHYIYKEKLFTIEELNYRIQGFNYGSNFNQNKPAEIFPNHLTKTKCLAMSSAEMLTLVRNLCIILGDLIDDGNEYWNQLKYLKIMIEIISSKVVSKGTHNYLSSYITSYLQLHNKLFPDLRIFKHHILIHYPRIFEKVAILSQISSIRNESKHQENKISSRSSKNRVNVCHTMAIRNQLRLHHRFTVGCHLEFNSNTSSKKYIMIQDILDTIGFTGSLPKNIQDPVQEITWINLKNRRIANNSIIMEPAEDGPLYYKVKKILMANDNQVFFLTQYLEDYYFDDHTQSFKVINNSWNSWKFLSYSDLDHCTITCFNILKDETYITKLWI